MATNFKTLTEAKAAYEALEATHAEAVINLASAQAQAQKNFADFTQVSADAKALTEALALSTQKMEGYDAKLTASAAEVTAANAATEAAKVITTEAINRKASELIASAGHAPVNIGQDYVASANKTMPRAEFNKLNAGGKAAAMKAGVKLSD